MKNFREKYSLLTVKKDIIEEIGYLSNTTNIVFEYGPLWTQENIVSFIGYIVCYVDEKTKNVFRNIYMKYYVKEILETVLDSSNKMIIKMYWYEFIKIRNQFLAVALNVQSLHSSKFLNTTTSIQQLLIKYDSDVDDIENIIKKQFKVQEQFICKICLHSNISHGFVHKKHVCAICSSCAEKCTESSDKCPFCRLLIQDTIKIIS